MRWQDGPWLNLALFLASQEEPGDEPDPAPLSPRALLAVLVLLAALVLASLHIIDALRQTDHLQDCVMQGRTNCAGAIVTRHH